MIKRSLLLLVGLLALCVGVGLGIFSYAHQPVMPNDNEIIVAETNTASVKQDNRAQKWLTTYYEKYRLPSLSAAVAVKGEIVWAGSIGYSNISDRTRATPRTQYRFGSVAKSITSAALIKLDSQGELDIDMPFTDYVSDWRDTNVNFTLADLASHQAGIRHYGSGLNQVTENLRDKAFANMRDAARLVENDEVLFAPGEGFSYTTYGYTLLGLAMERATGQDFSSIVQKQILVPAGMTDTELEQREAVYPNKAVSYLNLGGYNITAPKVNLSYKYPGGGYLSTPSDVARFGSMLLNDRAISKEELVQITTPRAMKSGKVNPDNYGFGFNIGSDQIGQHFSHGGLSVGGRSFMVVYPGKQMVIAFVSNVTPGELKMDRRKAALELGLEFQYQ